MSDPNDAQLTAAVDEISREVRKLQEESYGAGADEIQVYVHDEAVLILIDVRLTRAEQTLIDAGRETAVKEMRENFQIAIAPTFTAIVERATGRRVTSFYSGMNMDPIYSIEVFRLGEPG